MPQYLFLIAFLAAVIFFIALIKTDFALVILIFSMLLSPEFGAGAIPGGRAVVIRFDDIFLFVVFFGWLARMALNKELGLLKITPLNRPIMVYISICIIATLLGVLQGYVKIQRGVFFLLKYIEYFLLFFMVVNNLKTMKQVRTFVFFIFLTAFLVCIYGWRQIPAGLRVSAPFEGVEGEPNTFAGYLILIMALILGFILHSESVKKRFLLLGLLGFTIVPFMYTLSRGGWLGFFAMYLALIVFSKRFKVLLVFLSISMFLIMPCFMPQAIQSRIGETFVADKTYTILGKKVALAESAAARVDSWKYGLQKWSRRPILGFGIPTASVVDNQFTLVLTETGILGFAAFLWIISRIFRLGLHTYANFPENNFAQSLSLGVLAGLVGIIAQSFTAANFIIVRIMEPFWFIVAILVIVSEIQSENKGLQ